MTKDLKIGKKFTFTSYATYDNERHAHLTQALRDRDRARLRCKILSILPRKMLEGACDTERDRAWEMSRKDVECLALTYWDSLEGEAFEYLKGAIEL